MSLSEERKEILSMIDRGVISAEEGFKLLQALETEEAGATADSPEGDPAIQTSTTPEDAPPPPSMAPDAEEIARWKRWWLIPVYAGAGVTVLGGLLMYLAWSNHGPGFWFACAWLPFLLGVALLALAWGSQNAVWLHVRVQQKPGQKPARIAISFPLPIRLTAWGLRNFGHRIPNLDAIGLDEVILALGESKTAETPLFVDVDEGADGERVQIFIG